MRAKGFTLIELMIVVAVIVILLVMFVSAIKPAHSCVDFGYPHQLSTSRDVYCIRTVNGTDQTVRLRDLVDRDRQQIER